MMERDTKSGERRPGLNRVKRRRLRLHRSRERKRVDNVAEALMAEEVRLFRRAGGGTGSNRSAGEEGAEPRAGTRPPDV